MLQEIYWILPSGPLLCFFSIGTRPWAGSYTVVAVAASAAAGSGAAAAATAAAAGIGLVEQEKHGYYTKTSHTTLAQYQAL